ncbi:MAG: sigma-70 family RNA polymerase sigma factor [Planctomycetota bacterium]
MKHSRPFEFRKQLMHSEDPRFWDDLVRAVHAPTMMLLIEARLGSHLRGRVNSEYVWHQTLLKAWSVREEFDGNDIHTLRRWLAGIAEDCLLKRIRQSAAALKLLKENPPPDAIYAGPVATTEPRTVATDRAEAAAMRSVLNGLPAELRYTVWLQEFENLSVQEIADRLELPADTIQAQLRRGLIAYRHKLRALLNKTVAAHF